MTNINYAYTFEAVTISTHQIKHLQNNQKDFEWQYSYNVINLTIILTVHDFTATSGERNIYIGQW